MLFTKKKEEEKKHISLTRLHYGEYTDEEIDEALKQEPMLTKKQKMVISVATGILGIVGIAYSLLINQDLYKIGGILSLLATVVIVSHLYVNTDDNNKASKGDTSILDGSGYSPFNPKH